MKTASRFYVYVLFRPTGEPCYVGKGCRSRFHHHERHTHNRHLANIIAAAGGSVPKIKVRENLTDAEAIETEVALISAIGRKIRGGPLVNMTDGGDGLSGPKSAAHMEAIRLAKIGKPPTKAQEAQYAAQRGKPLSRAALEASAAKTRGVPLSAETKAKLRIANEGAPLTEARRLAYAARRGLRHSEATKAAISSANRGQKRSEAICLAMSIARLGKLQSDEQAAASLKRRGLALTAATAAAAIVNRGKAKPEAWRIAQSERARRLWQDPAFRARRGLAPMNSELKESHEQEL
jgi:hypothetical protein